MPPWDAAPYFQPVKVSSVTVGSSATLICDANPQRVGLIIGVPVSGSTFTVLPSPLVNGNSFGLGVGTALPQLQFTQADWGNLVQCAWYATQLAGGSKITVIEVILQDWPGEGSPRLQTGEQ